MMATDAIRKSRSPKLFHMTCVAHLLHNYAQRAKSHFEDVDQLIKKPKSNG